MKASLLEHTSLQAHTSSHNHKRAQPPPDDVHDDSARRHGAHRRGNSQHARVLAASPSSILTRPPQHCGSKVKVKVTVTVTATVAVTGAVAVAVAVLWLTPGLKEHTKSTNEVNERSERTK